MKQIIRQPEVMIKDHCLALPASKKGKGHYLPILVAVVEQLDAMLSYHCKVLIFRLDFHLHEPTVDNKPISTFMRQFSSYLKRNGVKRLGYLWCREQSESSSQHYHVVFMVDANKHRHPYSLIVAAEHYWKDWELGTVFTPKKCYQKLERADAAGFQRAFDRLSYLGKVDSKQQRLSTVNDYSASRLKPKVSKLNLPNDLG